MELSVPPVGDTDPEYDPHQRLLTDDDVDITNRAKGEVTPFSRIEKRPSTTQNENLTGYGIEVRDHSQDNGWRLVGNVSKNYLLVSNAEVVEIIHDIIEQSPLAHRPRKVFFDGKRFVYNTIFPQQRIDGPREDDITFGLQVRNSYNASMRFQAALFAERLVCENGMTSTTEFSSHRFQHRQSSDGWQEDLEGALSVLSRANDQLTNFVSKLYELERTSIDEQDLMRLRREDRGLGELPVSRFGEVFDELTDSVPLGEDNGRMHEGTAATGYDVLNAATNVLWHRDRSTTDLDYNTGVVDQLVSFASDHVN